MRMNHKVAIRLYRDIQNATMTHMAIFSRMHSLSAGMKFGYFNHVTNSIRKLSIYWLYIRQKYFGWRRRCDRGRCKTPSPARRSRRKPPKDPENPIAEARRRRGRERPEWRARGSRRRRCLEGLARPAGSKSGYWLGPGGETGAASARVVVDRNPFRGGRRRERRECVLCDEYAYIRANWAATHPFRDVSGAKPDRARAKPTYFAATLFWPAAFGRRRARLARRTAPLYMCGAFL